MSFSLFSVLVLVLLSRDEPPDTVCPEDGVYCEACDEEDREDQQPVNALHRDTGERAETILFGHVSVCASFKPCSIKTILSHTSLSSQEIRTSFILAQNTQQLSNHCYSDWKHTCLIRNEGRECLKCSICLIKASHRFNSLKQQDVGHRHCPEPCGEAGGRQSQTANILLHTYGISKT